MATAVHETTAAQSIATPPSDSVVVRFAGDSGDGMQLTGGQFTLSTALTGNDLATFPDFPAEIRAPQGTLFGVSAFQINFGSDQIDTAGDQPDVLVAMNPAALKTNVSALKSGGLIIAYPVLSGLAVLSWYRLKKLAVVAWNGTFHPDLRDDALAVRHAVLAALEAPAHENSLATAVPTA